MSGGPLNERPIEKYLIQGDRPLICLPFLAEAIGINKAVILQQLHWLLLDPKNGKVLSDGHKYIYNTYEEWSSQYFIWLTPRTLMKHFVELERAGLIASRQPDGVISRRKYYRTLVGGQNDT